MSRIWKFNLTILTIIVIAVIYLMLMKKSVPASEPLPKPTPVVEPSVEILEQAESIYGYTSEGETLPGESESVHLTKAITVTNPHDFPVTMSGITNDTYDTSGLLISSDKMFGLSNHRTIAPGEVAHIAATENLSGISFREDYGSSETKFEVFKNKGAIVPYTNLDTISASYQFKDADPGNTFLAIDATFANSSSINVDTSELQFVVFFYDHNGSLLGGNNQKRITYKPERIRPGDQKQISFEGELLGKQFSRNISSIQVFAGCDKCRA